MSGSPATEWEYLVARARQGDPVSLGALLQRYRNYLQIVARTQIDLHLNVRVSPSDVVQEAYLQAVRNFDSFGGHDERSLLAWLRTILVRAVLAAYDRHLKAARRTVRRQVSLHELVQRMEHSSRHIDAALAGQDESPSTAVRHGELAALVADRLAELPDGQREVIVLRNLEGLSFEAVAERMGKSSTAVRQQWVRAITRLRLSVQEADEA
jgi:RNA polymerase sigma-70 factor (ECF subfamily)